MEQWSVLLLLNWNSFVYLVLFPSRPPLAYVLLIFFVNLIIKLFPIVLFFLPLSNFVFITSLFFLLDILLTIGLIIAKVWIFIHSWWLSTRPICFAKIWFQCNMWITGFLACDILVLFLCFCLFIAPQMCLFNIISTSFAFNRSEVLIFAVFTPRSSSAFFSRRCGWFKKTS